MKIVSSKRNLPVEATYVIYCASQNIDLKYECTYVYSIIDQVSE